MYKILSDSSCDLSVEQVKENNIGIIPFHIRIGDHDYKENVDLSIADFYQYVVDHPDVYPKTSTPSIEEYADVFRKTIEEGYDIICICITIKFSGSYNSARLAKDMILEDYPNAKITVIDCTFNTDLQGLYVLEAAKLCQQQVPYEKAVAALLPIRKTGRIFFSVGNLDYLIHGGRIGKVAGTAANVLGVKPLIVLHDGEIFSFGVARGRKRSIRKSIDETFKYMKENQVIPNEWAMTVGYGYDKEEGERVRKQFEERLHQEYPDTNIQIPLMRIGATIGVHTGPYPIGVGLIKKPVIE